MINPNSLPVPKSVTDDAKQRALRTWFGGILAAVVIAVLPVLDAAVGNIQWSTAWWLALGNAVLAPAIGAAMSYVLRHLAPPA